MRIGILGHNFTLWGGGVDFLRLIIDSLLSISDEESIELFLLIPDAGPVASIREKLRILKHAAQGLSKGDFSLGKVTPQQNIIEHTFSEFQGRIEFHHIHWGKSALLKAAHQLSLDVLLPSVYSLGPNFPIPWVGYGYDFQHKYLPEYFSALEIKKRDYAYSRIIRDAKTIIVNANAVARDIEEFLPHGKAKVFSLPFSASPNPVWLQETQGVPEKYGIQTPYFMVSNQFWIHKDHKTLFHAFEKVCEHNKEVLLVCTGNTYDPRDPRHFKNLMQQIEQAGIKDRIHILGLIPKKDQIDLMKGTLSVVQPTLFEGGPGGGAIFDAVSLGVPSILSDIPVNQEISNLDVTYFPAGDANTLAALMIAAIDKKTQRTDPETLLNEGILRRKACGHVILKAARHITLPSP